MKISKL